MSSLHFSIGLKRICTVPVLFISLYVSDTTFVLMTAMRDYLYCIHVNRKSYSLINNVPFKIRMLGPNHAKKPAMIVD